MPDFNFKVKMQYLYADKPNILYSYGKYTSTVFRIWCINWDLKRYTYLILEKNITDERLVTYNTSNYK